MITSKVEYTGNLRTEAVHIRSNEKVITDAPIDNQGKGEAFSPTDLMSTSLASCMMTIIGINANANNYDINGASAEVTKIMADNPRRIGEIRIELTFPKNNYSEKEKKLIINSAKTCPIAKSIHPDIKLSINFNF